MTKIDIFSGFLGAGKTTLIKKLLSEAYAGEKVVLIENEFGEIGIDGGFLREAGIEITEMNSGCICCSLVGDFTEALRKVLSDFHPDRILIEPSGVGKLSDVIHAVEKVADKDVLLNSFTTVADASKCRVYLKNFGEFYGDQVANAGTIILSRTAGMSEDKLEKAVALLREHNAEATIITTPWDALDGKVILAAMEQKNTLASELEKLAEETEHHHHHHHHHDEECECGCHHHEHEHHHHHDEECECGCHHHDHEHHHHHDGECECGCHHHEHEHHHHHDEECECGCHHHEHEHHHHHDGECECGCHHHEHDHEHHHHHDEECECGCHHHEHDHEHHHHADEVFSTWGRETTKTFTEDEIRRVLEAFDSGKYGTVLRAKGIVAGENGAWIHFDYVPEEISVRTGGADIIGRLCVIGAKLDEGAIASLFGIN